jgi:hypothetical protein
MPEQKDLDDWRTKLGAMTELEIEAGLASSTPWKIWKQDEARNVLRERRATATGTAKAADEARFKAKFAQDEERNRIARDANTRANWAIAIAILALLASAANAIHEWLPLAS